MYIYRIRTSSARVRAPHTDTNARDLIGNTCAAFIVRFYSQIFATCSEHVYSEYFQKSSETIARQGKQATAHTRTRERARRAAETAEQRQKRLTKRREIGLGALPRLPMHI